MKILFVSYSRGWGFSEDTYQYVFKPIGAKHHRLTWGIKQYLKFFWDFGIHKYDVLWCEESSFLPCLIRWFFRTNRAKALHIDKLYRGKNAKIITRFHYHNVSEFLERHGWKAILPYMESDVVVCVSNYWRRELKKAFPFWKKHVPIVHNGIDTQKYIPNAKIKENNRIFYLASTYPRKRLHLLIQAMEYLPKNYTLAIGGMCKPFEVLEEGDVLDPTIPKECLYVKKYWAWCHELAKPYGDRIEWLGFLSEQEKIREHQRASIFVMPSRCENWGVTIMESMSVQNPVLVTNSGGMPEFVPDSQLLPQNPTPEEISEKICKLSGNGSIGYSNRKIVEKYDWKNIRQEINEILVTVQKEL